MKRCCWGAGKPVAKQIWHDDEVACAVERTPVADQPFRIAVCCSKRCWIDNDIVSGRVEGAIGLIGEFCIVEDAPRLQGNVAQFKMIIMHPVAFQG